MADDNPDWSDHHAEPMDAAAKLKATRARLALSQAEFATLLNLPAATLANWEQRVTKPDALGLTMIDLIYDDPVGITERLRRKRVA